MALATELDCYQVIQELLPKLEELRTDLKNERSNVYGDLESLRTSGAKNRDELTRLARRELVKYTAMLSVVKDLVSFSKTLCTYMEPQKGVRR